MTTRSPSSFIRLSLDARRLNGYGCGWVGSSSAGNGSFETRDESAEESGSYGFAKVRSPPPPPSTGALTPWHWGKRTSAARNAHAVATGRIRKRRNGFRDMDPLLSGRRFEPARRGPRRNRAKVPFPRRV
jgi:hypothetical protein